MKYIKADKICFEYPGQSDCLFDSVSVEINDDNRVGLIGDNGCGKSTLFKIIQGEISPVRGNFYRARNLNVILMPQTLDSWNHLLVSEYLKGASNDYERDKIFSLLHLDVMTLGKHILDLSGGEKTKISLCHALLKKPDLLLLDEPTNNLDEETLEWLENYLDTLTIPFCIVSHDRRFLDETVTCIWEIRQKNLFTYSGNYSFYKHERKIEEERAMHLHQVQQKKLKQLKKVVRERRGWAEVHQKETRPNGYAPKYKVIDNFARKAMKRAKNVEQRINIMIEREEAKKPVLKKWRKISFAEVELKSKVVLHVENLSMKFDDNIVLKNVNLQIKNKDRVAITGPNGSGKSTLLSLIMNESLPLSGSVRWAPQCRVGYYRQGRSDLDHDLTVLEEVLQGNHENETRARTFMGSLHLPEEKMHQRISTLSAGEQCKVALSKILLSDVNVLVLDEPTNHLEISVIEALESALRNFSGTLILVTHDRALRNTLTDYKYEMGGHGHYTDI